jgi:phospho-N-acetylmuramoyl-pentapeptide-transferase
MLYYLSELTHWISALNVFRYVTFRAFMGAGTAFLLSLLLGRWMIGRLRACKIGQVVRQDPELAAIDHGGKAGTPTMGGLLILFTTLVSARCSGAIRPIPRCGWWWPRCCSWAGVGFADDWLKLSRDRIPRG